jgi:hypothetical protein
MLQVTLTSCVLVLICSATNICRAETIGNTNTSVASCVNSNCRQLDSVSKCRARFLGGLGRQEQEIARAEMAACARAARRAFEVCSRACGAPASFNPNP